MKFMNETSTRVMVLLAAGIASVLVWISGFFYKQMRVSACELGVETERLKRDQALEEAIIRETRVLEEEHKENLQAFAVLAQQERSQTRRLLELRALTRTQE
ncbi:MAG: hypothetical protein EOM23_11590 [Candidatus Moranbacteria bacterium]|nr:hypothetical protein [Candidatus Moranbacteria bacterium]